MQNFSLKRVVARFIFQCLRCPKLRITEESKHFFASLDSYVVPYNKMTPCQIWLGEKSDKNLSDKLSVYNTKLHGSSKNPEIVPLLTVKKFGCLLSPIPWTPGSYSAKFISSLNDTTEKILELHCITYL